MPASVWAQRSVALDRFEPSPASDLLFAVPGADVTGRFQASAGMSWSFAVAPLSTEEDTSLPAAPVVSHQVTAHLQGGLEIFRRLKLDVDIPFTVSQRGQPPPASSGSDLQAPKGAALNDIRAGVRVLLLRPQGARPGASLAFSMWVPSGDEDDYAGSVAFRYAPSVIVGGTTSFVGWSAMLGRRFEASSDAKSLLGSEVLFGAGAMFGLGGGGFGFGPEIFGTSAASAGTGVFSKRTTSLEAGLVGRVTVGSLAFRAGFSAGLVRGIGEPALRIVFGMDMKAPEPAFASKWDGLWREGGAGGVGDGGAAGTRVADEEKGAADALNGTKAGLEDTDGDGVADAQDACPMVAGVADKHAKRLGCPLDSDGDEVADVDDRCPKVAGIRHVDPNQNGCPRDSDGDGIADGEDACPADKGIGTADAQTRGCPATVRVQGTQIVLLQQIRFVEGSNELAEESTAILRDVVHVLGEHPEIARVAVDGHTDNVGSEAVNIELSQRRAVAVARWLLQHGIDARRIETRGFGPRRPISTNDTEEGRAQNRRVEFQIRKRSPEGEAGWVDGPIE